MQTFLDQTMIPISPRRITAEERDLLIAALERAPVATFVAGNLGETIPELMVIGRCECGCASVTFSPQGEGISDMVADGLATDPTGESVGLILWARHGRFTELEIVGHSDVPAGLPSAISVRSYEEEGRRMSQA
ncbi:MAG: hypothetical protein V4505_13375 [Pseudomonadota bacterium]